MLVQTGVRHQFSLYLTPHPSLCLFLKAPMSRALWVGSSRPRVLDVCDRSMGQKDHVEAGAGHILDLGLDLEYLHVAGADCQAGAADGPPAMEEQGESSSTSSTANSPPPTVVEDNAGSDAEGEPGSSSSATLAAGSDPDGAEGALTHSKSTHQPLCRTQCVDLGTEGPPEPPSEPTLELEHDTPPQSSPSSPCKHPPESSSNQEPVSEAGGKEYQAKLEFALKLGYSEETVRLVLSKLGPDTLINDILGELVKLGTKSDSEQPAGSLASTSSSSSSSSSCGCSDLLDGQRSDSPCPSDSLCDQDNLRPIVVDGSNVAMRWAAYEQNVLYWFHIADFVCVFLLKMAVWTYKNNPKY